MRRYLKSAERVSNRAENDVALSERGRRVTSRDRTSEYLGDRVDRRSCVSFCSKLEESQLGDRRQSISITHSSNGFIASSSATEIAVSHASTTSFQ
jgi:hypothetical protein